mgnify:CR=1 FL=1
MGRDRKNNSEIILYQAEDGKTRIEVRLQEDYIKLLVFYSGLLYNIR